MPIYEFYCADCHRIFSFLSRAIDTAKQPACPRCHRPNLTRKVSSFAISKGRKEADTPDGTPPDIDDARLERAMQAIAGDIDNLNEDDPKQAAHLMRKLFGATGMPMNTGMEEALRRMESGEDPEKIEAEMGDVFEQDPFSAGADLNPASAGGLKGLRRKVLPPSVDDGLYEM